MAEVVAAISLAASIAGLLDICSKVVLRISAVRSRLLDLPQGLSQLAAYLPLLTLTLQRVEVQAEDTLSPSEIVEAVAAVVRDTSFHCQLLEQFLTESLAHSSTSGIQRAFANLKALKSEQPWKKSAEKIRQNLAILTFYQHTAQSASIEEIRERITKDSIAGRKNALTESRHRLGLVLGTAPTLDVDAFIGRKAEIDSLNTLLFSEGSTNVQRVISIVGIGGIGKTQLSIAYARKFADRFSSVFWLDAAEITDARQSMARAWGSIEPHLSPPQRPATEDEKVQSFRDWLAEPWNTDWLLIFDNHDNPALPGTTSPSAYDLRSLFPSRDHGKILISSRSADLTYTRRFYLKELEAFDTAKELLSHRAGRDITQGMSRHFFRIWYSTFASNSIYDHLSGLRFLHILASFSEPGTMIDIEHSRYRSLPLTSAGSEISLANNWQTGRQKP